MGVFRSLLLLLHMREDEITISKEVLPSLEGLDDLSETNLGYKRRSQKQYRKSAGGLHVREYRDKFVIHEDKIDPRINPLAHLVRDSPETLVAFGIASTIFLRNRKQQQDNSPDREGAFRFSNSFTFLFAFFSLNKLLGKIKRSLSLLF
ncbi:MAG: hypothetical protein ACREBS_11290 [Nitrososphaerales archaeon]